MDQNRRLILDTKLHSDFDGIAHIYYQPPASVQMQYPAIRYKRSFIDITHADNVPYLKDRSYELTVIDRNPDSEITEKLLTYPGCRFNRNYIADNLHHDVITIYI